MDECRYTSKHSWPKNYMVVIYQIQGTTVLTQQEEIPVPNR